jgi:hypothetical protein
LYLSGGYEVGDHDTSAVMAASAAATPGAAQRTPAPAAGQRRVSHLLILFRLDHETRVFVGDTFYCTGQGPQVVDVLGNGTISAVLESGEKRMIRSPEVRSRRLPPVQT